MADAEAWGENASQEYAGLDEELAEPWDRSSLGGGMAQEAAQSGTLPSS